ncbi:MAG: hypothetical protein IPJ65_39425 [Archangiaceae bacterium]|nr:hypothetical protein [Archangiaceae bacterium]
MKTGPRSSSLAPPSPPLGQPAVTGAADVVEAAAVVPVATPRASEAPFREAPSAQRRRPPERASAPAAVQPAVTTPRVFATLDDLRGAVADTDLAKTFADARLPLEALPPAGRAAAEALAASGASAVNAFAFEAPLGRVTFLLSRAPPPAPVLQLLDRSGTVFDEARRPRTDFSWEPAGPASVRDFASGNLREVGEAQRSSRDALPGAVRAAAGEVPERASWFHPEAGAWVAQWLGPSGSSVIAFDDDGAVLTRGSRPFSVFEFGGLGLP